MRPVAPADALASLLQICGIAAAQIPAGLEARMALWRDYLASRRILLLLDDAAGSEQIQPLLPGAGENLVLITSRRHLTALEDATTISLDTLPAQDADELLARLAARPGLKASDPAMTKIARLCGRLPLAIAMLGRQLRHHPAWTPADLAADLAAARDRLELMQAENLSVAAAFDLSYQDLTVEVQRLFRCLGLHPGTTVDAYAAAALAGIGPDEARSGLDALYEQHLLTEPARGRYRFHDLIRERARALAGADQESGRREELERLLAYYQHTAAIAEGLLARRTRTRPSLAHPAVPPAAAPSMAERPQALAWVRTERANILACLDHAARTGQLTRAVALTAGIAALLRHDGPWTDAITRHTAAAEAAAQLGDRLSEASALYEVGTMRRLTGDYHGAAKALGAALSISEDLGDHPGQANALCELGTMRRQTGDYEGAAKALESAIGIYNDTGDRLGEADAFQQLGTVRHAIGDSRGAIEAYETALGISQDAGDSLGQADALRQLAAIDENIQRGAKALEVTLGIYSDLGHRPGQATNLCYLGMLKRMIGDYQGAAKALEKALALCRDLCDRGGEVQSLNELGMLHQARGDLERASELHQKALDLSREIASPWDEAHALAGLGRCALEAGRIAEAQADFQQAHAIFQRIGDRAGGQTDVLNDMAKLHRVRGDLDQAGALHRQALDLAQEIDNPREEAHALAGLGRCALEAGRIAEAQAHLRQALTIFQQMDAAEASILAAELDAISWPEPNDRAR